MGDQCAYALPAASLVEESGRLTGAQPTTRLAVLNERRHALIYKHVYRVERLERRLERRRSAEEMQDGHGVRPLDKAEPARKGWRQSILLGVHCLLEVFERCLQCDGARRPSRVEMLRQHRHARAVDLAGGDRA